MFAFDEVARAELSRLTAGDSLTVQGAAKLSVYEKTGEWRPSLDGTAAHVLALRQPPKKRAPKQADDRKGGSAWDDGFPENFGGSDR